ncbi:MAG: hypothetical protein ABR955_08120 [Verrucomicrobiota bacterium]
MKTKTIKHKILIRATSWEIYDALMNGKKHSQFTGDATKIRAKAGTAFSCYSGYITGIKLELKPGKCMCRRGARKVGCMDIIPS